jgi:hypothetical protein
MSYKPPQMDNKNETLAWGLNMVITFHHHKDVTSLLNRLELDTFYGMTYAMKNKHKVST